MNKSLFLASVLFFSPAISLADRAPLSPVLVTPGSEVKKGQPRSTAPRAAIFVQNHAGPDMEEWVPTFRDFLTARLAEKGLAVIDGHDMAERFQETEGPKDPVVAVLRDFAKGTESIKTEASVEQVLNGASAVRIAQMLEADFLIVATFASVGFEQKFFRGEGTLYKTDNEVMTRSLRTSLKVLESTRGSTVYGDTVVIRDRRAANKSVLTVMNDGDASLIDEAATMIADNIGAGIQRILDTDVDAPSTAHVEVNANVEGATVELDGAALGSAPGTFAIRPGIHEIAVSKERYVTWRKTVNIVPNQVFNVTLERSAIGEERAEGSLRVAREDELIRKTTEASVDIAKEQSAAEAYAKRQVAEGEKVFRKKSHTRIEGPAHEVNIGSSADVKVKVEKE